MSRLVDDRTLEQLRGLDALDVLEQLGCYAKRDVSFHPVTAKRTARYHVNANGRDWELLITGPKFWDARADRGGGGAIDLVMHLFNLDFKRALQRLHTLPKVQATPQRGRQRNSSGSSILDSHAGPDDGAA
ncbi:hypothetical protein [Paraburkholderia sediminicola]|uniref:hypothetical protein n=1 Tax=Paraburkholderia sediminicola TaxID=458836 RepID=UPI0038B840AB